MVLSLGWAHLFCVHDKLAFFSIACIYCFSGLACSGGGCYILGIIIVNSFFTIKDALASKTSSECNITLKNIRSGNINKLIFPHLNINPTRNKFEFLDTQVKEKIDILMIFLKEVF